MSANQMSTYAPGGKIDFKPKRYHGWAVLLFICGTLFPPLAVAARFGIGTDFWLNLLFTLMGYFPGHGHNFYIQNIRNNKTHARTPKWVQKYGLVDTSKIERNKKKSQWAGRYNDRLAQSTHTGQAYAEGEQGGSNSDLSSLNNRRVQPQQTGDLWREEDENYYQASEPAASTGRWHYPANFEDAVVDRPNSGKKKKDKKDRWARTEDAYSQHEESGTKKKMRRKKKPSAPSLQSRDSSVNYPEDAEGGLYGNNEPPSSSRARRDNDETDLNHTF